MRYKVRSCFEKRTKARLDTVHLQSQCSGGGDVGSLPVWNQLILHRELQTSQGFIVRPCLKTKQGGRGGEDDDNDNNKEGEEGETRNKGNAKPGSGSWQRNLNPHVQQQRRRHCKLYRFSFFPAIEILSTPFHSCMPSTQEAEEKGHCQSGIKARLWFKTTITQDISSSAMCKGSVTVSKHRAAASVRLDPTEQRERWFIQKSSERLQHFRWTKTWALPPKGPQRHQQEAPSGRADVQVPEMSSRTELASTSV